MKPRLLHLLWGPVLALTLTTLASHGASKEWRGTVFNSRWSEPDNWDPRGAPQDGDDLNFEASGFPNPQFPLMTNDLTGLVVQNLAFPSGSWQLRGNELGVRGAIGNSGDGLVQINCAIRLEGVGASSFSALSTLPSDTSDLRLTGPINLNGHTLVLVARSGATLDLAGPISGTGSIRINAETLNYFSDTGEVRFSGAQANTFEGSVTLGSQGGSLLLSHKGANLILDKQSVIAIPGAVLAGTNCTVKLDRPNQIADDSIVSLGAGAYLLLQGNTETIGSLNMTGSYSGLAGYFPDLGRSVVDTGGATLSVEGNIAASNFHSNDVSRIQGQLGLPQGSHVIHTSGTEDFALRIEASIVGEGGFTKTGPRGLILEGDSSFNGDAVLQEGLVHVSHANALGSPSGATIMEGGELEVRDTAIGIETLWANRRSTRIPELAALLNVLGASSWAGPIELNTNLTVSGGTMTFSGPITGPGGLRLIFNDRVQLTGPAGNSYSGDTITDASLLELNKPPGVAAFGGRLIVGAGRGRTAEVRWLQDYQRVGAEVILYSTPGVEALINLNNHREDFGPVTFNGGFIDTGPNGELGLYGLVNVTAWEGDAVINGRIGLPPGLHEFHVNDASRLADLTVNAVVIGPGHIRKTGFGQMWLNASNSYAGLTTVVEGSLVAFNANALGNPTTGTTVNDGASLILNATGTTVREPLALSGAGDGAHGVLNVFGDITLRNDFPSIFAAIDFTTNVTIRVEPGSRLVVNGFISGIGPFTKTGPGLLVLANINPNTYSGDTFVADGVLNLSKPNQAISVPGDLFIGPAPLNSTAIARWSTEGGMNPGATATINAGSLLDLNGNGQTLTRLNLNDGGDVETGAGRLSFQNGGTVNVGSLRLLGSHEGSSFNGNIGLPANAALTFAVSPFAPTPPFHLGPELDVNANIPAPVENATFERAGISKTGGGRMRIIGNNSFRGWVDVGEGVLTVGNSTALGAVFIQSGTYVFNTGVLQLEGGVNVEGEWLILNSTATPALEGIFGESYWSGAVTMSRHSTVGVSASTILQLAGVISGTANLTKIGSGTLRFGGGDHNTYSGETFINEGVFLMSKPLAVTAVPGPLSIGTPAGLPAMAANLVGYQVIGNIFVNRNGLLNLNGQEENVDHLWLSEGGDVQTTTGFLYLKTGGSIRALPGASSDPSTFSGNLGMDPGQHDFIIVPGNNLSGAPELTIDAVISQPLATTGLQKSGAGTLRVTANNTYRGLTVVNEGVLRVDGSQPLSPVRVNAAGTLKGSGYVGNITFTGNGGVVAPGASPGVLACSSFNIGSSGSGILEIELNGPALGTGYDQLNVGDFMNLSGVALRAKANFNAATNQQFVIANLFEFDPVQGEFTGLPHNATFTVDDQIFRISYAGGDGNEVVLTKIADVFRPTLTIQKVSPASVRLLWPTTFAGYTLQSTTNLDAANWSAALPLPAVTGTNNVVTNGSGNARQFYRLFKP